MPASLDALLSGCEIVGARCSARGSTLANSDGEGTIREQEHLHKLNSELAQAAWKEHRDAVVGSIAFTTQYGVVALTVPVNVNAASIAALLAFVSANAPKLVGKSDAIASCFALFSIGFVVSAVASGFAYIAQYCYTHASGSYTKSLKHPYVSTVETQYTTFAYLTHYLSAACIIFGYLFLIFGFANFVPILIHATRFEALPH